MDVVIYAVVVKKKGLNLRELLRFGGGGGGGGGHYAAVNAILPLGRFVVSVGQDKEIFLWKISSPNIPSKKYSASAPVFCAVVLPIKEENTPLDELTLTDALIAGTMDGKLVVLPLPLSTTGTLTNNDNTSSLMHTLSNTPLQYPR